MRIAHITLDEVNRALVRSWMKATGLRVARPTGAGLVWAADGSAVVLDLDHLPPDVRAGWVRRVVTGEVGGPVLVHGHNITEAEAAALRRSGVSVCRGRIRRSAVRAWLPAPADTVR